MSDAQHRDEKRPGFLRRHGGKLLLGGSLLAAGSAALAARRAGTERSLRKVTRAGERAISPVVGAGKSVGAVVGGVKDFATKRGDGSKRSFGWIGKKLRGS